MAQFRMKPNDSTKQPKHLIAFSCSAERIPIAAASRAEQLLLRDWLCRYVRLHDATIVDDHSQAGTSPQGFWQLLHSIAKPRQALVVVGYRTSQLLDLLEWRKELQAGGISIFAEQPKETPGSSDQQQKLNASFVVLADPPLILKLRSRSGGSITFLDIRNWFRCGIGELCSKAGAGIETEISEIPEPDSWGVEICAHVAAVSHHLLAYWESVKRLDLGMVRFTVAAQAAGCYRHRFLGDQPPVFHDYPAVRCLERLSYFGGRTDCFRLGTFKGNFYQLDVRGLFPWVMREQKYPIKLIRANLGQPWTDEQPFDRPACCIATVAINSPHRAFPVRVGHQTIYAKGRFVTTLAGPELAIACRLGWVEAFGPWACYQLGDLFSEYVDYWQSRRFAAQQDGDRIGDWTCKLMLNSLYGKFAQKRSSWQPIRYENPFPSFQEFRQIDPLTKQVIRYVNLEDVTLKASEADVRWERISLLGGIDEATARNLSGEIDQASPAIASFVASYARVAMDAHRCALGVANCYYQAIDSLIVERDLTNAELINRLIGNSGLGSFKLEAVAGTVTIHGGHDYEIGGKKVCGHRPAGGSENSAGIYVCHQFPTLSESMLRGEDVPVVAMSREVARSVNYTRGRVHSNGFVDPLILENNYHDHRHPWEDVDCPRLYGRCEDKLAMGDKV